MNLSELLKGLSIDTWYKALVYIGGIVLIAAFFIDAKGITNDTLQLLAGGTLLFGLGVWSSIRKEYSVKPPNAYTGPAMRFEFTWHQPNLLGIVIELSGIVLIGAAIWKIVVSLI